MNKQTELIRQIIDAATADKLNDAVKAINEYVENEVVGFLALHGEGEDHEPMIREDFKEYLKKEQ
jgi:hypothetical protein